jgi:trehalose 6-phosphate synthase
MRPNGYIKAVYFACDAKINTTGHETIAEVHPPLALVLAVIAYAVVPIVDTMTLRWFIRDLDMRSQLIANAVQEPLSSLAGSGAKDKILALFNRVSKDERLYALALCDAFHAMVVKTAAFPEQLRCVGLSQLSHEFGTVVEHADGPLHVMTQPIEYAGSPARWSSSTT